MRFLVNGCAGPTVGRWLREQGHEVFSVYEEARGMHDDEVLTKAYNKKWVLITNDKDFGEKIFREQHPHPGIILLRLEDERSTNKILVLQRLLDRYSDQLQDQFVVATERQVRFAKEKTS
ncbi:MAG: DUF5615 family PIN-like protein [candidate division KSB1 bacterium]|nr:DUF5615 family PIN-like protein [candidate division KSB1 bacterium]